MKKSIITLLLGTTLVSTAVAITSLFNINSLKKELNTITKENNQLTQNLENTTKNYIDLEHRNKKLSKRFVNEINTIINLTDSVKGLDKNLKERQEKLLTNISAVQNLNSKNKQLEEVLKVRNELLFKVKEPSASDVRPNYKTLNANSTELSTSDIKTVLMRKKIRGDYTKTSNNKKIDAFKTSFKILTNENVIAGNKKVSVKVYNPENSALNYKEDLNIDYKNQKLNIVSLIEVNRDDITPGNYKVIAYIDNKEIKSSNILIE